MSFDRAKIVAEGGTYHDEKNPLIECAPFTVSSVAFESVQATGAAPAEIKEDANLPKRMVIEGVFQRADVRNANQRVYPRGLWERLLKTDSAVMRRVAEKAMIGHLEHPESGTTDLNKGAIRIEKVWMEADGTIRGRAIIFNTPEGQRLQEYIVTGTKVGISSRGTGTVDAKGVVCEDFQLETWDMVYNPSTPGAHPGLTSESEQAVHPRQVIESQTERDTIPSHRNSGTPMSLSQRITEANAAAQRLLATDPKRLGEAARRVLANEMLDMRAKLAKEFVGEERVAEIEKTIKSLDETRAQVENIDNAGAIDSVVGDEVKTAVPGGAFDVLSKSLGALAGDAKTKAVESVKSLADLIAANMGAIPHIQVAVEAAIAGKTVHTTEAESAELKKLLGEARDEIISKTKREEATLALFAEATARIKDLQGKVAVVESERDKAAQVIAELTAAGGKKETNEAKAPEAPAKKVEEAAKPKSLAERIADKVTAAKNKDDAALPAPGTKVESKKDAGEAVTKKALHEEVTSTSKKSGADLLAGPMKKLAEELGESRVR